jgi:hypothetical protein
MRIDEPVQSQVWVPYAQVVTFLTLQSHSNYSLLRQSEINKSRVCLGGGEGDKAYIISTWYS